MSTDTAQQTAPIEPPAETAEALLEQLRRLHADGRIGIELNSKRLTHIDSPVAFEAESNQWVYGLLIVTGLFWWQFGWQAGAATAAVSVAIYLTVGKAFLRKRIDRRVRDQVLVDVVRWRKLWNFGGVVLRDARNGGEDCAAPGGNWMAFTRRVAHE